MIKILCKFLNNSVSPIVRILTGTTTQVQRGPESKGHERVSSTYPKLQNWNHII